MKEIKDDEKALADAFFECCDYRVSKLESTTLCLEPDRRLPQIPGPMSRVTASSRPSGDRLQQPGWLIDLYLRWNFLAEVIRV